jgi:SAM-dependent methyltransferase
MNVRALMTLLPLLVRLYRQINELRGKQEPARPAQGRAPAPRKEPVSHPMAVRKPAATGGTVGPRRSRSSSPWLGSTLRMLVGAGLAGAAAYYAVRQQQRRLARRRPVHAPFPDELLDVLAPPGGEGQFFYSGDGLIDPNSDAFFPVIDGIPDFIGERAPQPGDWLVEVYDPAVHGLLIPLAWRGNRTGVAALAGAIAAEAYDGWCLSAPCGTGVYEIEMARANPQARIVCLDSSWEMLLEARRKALEAGLANLYFVRGDAELLPLQSGAFDSAWSALGFPTYAHPERAITQLSRTAKRGALVAGVSLVPGGPPLPDAALRLGAGRLRGLLDLQTFLSLLAASGLRELRATRDGAMVRFLGTRAG